MEKADNRCRLEGIASRLLGVSLRVHGSQAEKIHLAACWVNSASLHHSYQDWDGYRLPEPAEVKDLVQELRDACIDINNAVVPMEKRPLLEQATIQIQEAIYLIKTK